MSQIDFPVDGSSRKNLSPGKFLQWYYKPFYTRALRANVEKN